MKSDSQNAVNIFTINEKIEATVRKAVNIIDYVVWPLVGLFPSSDLQPDIDHTS